MRLTPALVAFAAACGPTAPPPPENAAPRARLSAPVAAKAGEEAFFDASSSFDSDGYVSVYRFNFGDGSPAMETGEPRQTHLYAQPGTYQVLLVVADDRGAEGRALQEVAVMENPPSCEGASACGAGESCTGGRCYRNGGSVCGDCLAVSCKADDECGQGRVCRAGSCAVP